MRLTLEGCGELYTACREIAGDFALRADGHCLSFQGTVHDMLFASASRVGESLLGNVIVMHNLLLRAHAALAEARGIKRREWEA